MTKKYQPVGLGMTPSKTELGSFIRARRLELDLRQVPLAEQCGIYQNDISHIEIGTRKYLDDDILNKLATALQCDVEELRKRMLIKPVKPVVQPTTEVGKLIRARREELGLTIEVFAKNLKIDPKKANLFEVRKSPTIHYEFLKPLAVVLKLDSSVLSRFVGNTRKQTKSELGQLVRSRRKELGLSLSGLADKMNVSRQFVNQIEFGQARLSTNDEMVARLAQALEIDVNKLDVVRPKRRLRTSMNGDNSLGQFLAAKRVDLRLSQRELGELADFTVSQIGGLEKDRLRVSADRLNMLSKVLKCEIPQDLIPPSCTTRRRTGLGKFLTEKRLELKLSQAEVAQRANVSFTTVSCIERGTYRPGVKSLERIANALQCKIPPELVPLRMSNGQDCDQKESDFVSLGSFRLTEQNHADLEKIKELSDIRANSEVIRKALKTLRLLLEKKNDQYVVCLRRGDTIVELEFLF